MLQPAIEILDANRKMAVSTVRSDGWPQTTIVGYANDGWTVYFLIFRSSQKFANIKRDDRVSIAVDNDSRYLGEVKAVFAGSHASEVKDPKERKLAWTMLLKKHPNLTDFGMPEDSETALMKAVCKYVSVLDYSQGIGHTEALTIGKGAGQDAASA